MTVYGRRRTASVSCPPSSYPTYPGGAPMRRDDRVSLHVLGHVDPDHGSLVIEQELGEGAGGLGLPDAGRPEEDEAPDGAVRILETRRGFGAPRSIPR